MHKMPLLTATRSLDQEKPATRKLSRKISVPSAFLRKKSALQIQKEVALNYSFPPASLQIQRQNGRNFRRGSTYSLASNYSNVTNIITGTNKRRKKGAVDDSRGNVVANIVESIIMGKAELVNQLANNGMDLLEPTRLVFSDQVASFGPRDNSHLKGAAGLMTSLAVDEADGVLVERKIIVSFLHLAVLEREVDSVRNIINYIASTKGSKGVKDDFIHKMLTDKVVVEVPGSKENNFNQDEVSMDGLNALHLAAQYSVECLDVFLNGPLAAEVASIMDDTNSYEETALHLAASNLESDSVRLLLKYGASVLVVDTKGDTALHVAAKTGSFETVALLLDHGSPIHARNQKARTCLFYARSPKMVALLLYYGAEVKARDSSNVTVLEYFLKKNPANAKAILADGIETNGKSEGASDLLLIYDLDLFKNPLEVISGEGVNPKKTCEMETISKFLDYRRKLLLREPLVETFLHLKWLRLRKFMFFNLFFYGLYLFSITGLTIWSTTVYSDQIFRNSTPEEHTEDIIISTDGFFYGQNTRLQKIGAWVLYVFTILCTLWPTIREVSQFFNNPHSYIRSMENWLEVILMTLSWIYFILLPVPDENAMTLLPGYVKTNIAAVIVFLAWIIATSLIGRFPSIGIYVYMSIKVVTQVLQFLLVYLTTLVAFTCAFHILMIRHDIFENFISTFLLVIVMMTGEFEFSDNFPFEKAEVYGISQDSNRGIVQLLFLSFVFLVTIIISNLIIGLTINNTKELFKEAGNYRLSKTVKQILEIEQILIKENFLSKVLSRFHNLMSENTQLFPLLTKLQKKSKVESTKLCIKPYAIKAMKDSNDHFLMGANDSNYEIYIFNEDKNKAEKSIKMSLPGWVVDNTFKCLAEKEERIHDVLKMQNRALLTHVEFGESHHRSSVERLGEFNEAYEPFSEVPQAPLRHSTEKKPRRSQVHQNAIREESISGLAEYQDLQYVDQELISDDDSDSNKTDDDEEDAKEYCDKSIDDSIDIASRIEKLPRLKKLTEIEENERRDSVSLDDSNVASTHV